MRRFLFPGVLGLALAAVCGFVSGQSADVKPPVARKVAKVTDIHGEKLVDNYYWLREKKDPEVIKHLEAENAYTAAFMKPTEKLQEKLYNEFLSHIQQTDLSVPVLNRGYWYYTRTEEGKQYPIHCRKKGSLDAKEEILLDVNELAKGHKFFNVNYRQVSDDGNLLAYTTDTTGFRAYTLRVKDLRTGKDLAENISPVDSVVWAADNQTLFYVKEDEAHRAYRLYRHKLGDPQEKDALLHDEKDELFNIEVSHSRDRQYLFLTIGSYTSTEVRYLNRDQPGGDLKMVAPREDDHRYDVGHRNGKFYIRTNKGAKNFRLVTAPAATPGPKYWEELIPHRPEVLLDGVDVFAGHLVLEERFNGLDRLVVFVPETKQRTEIAFDEPTYSLGGSANPEFDTKKFRFSFQSFVTPNSVYEYDVVKQDRRLLKQTKVLGGYDPKQYHAERIWATAKDGVKVPISIVYKKGVKLDGKAPMLLYGYGAYGLTNPATFSEPRLSLLDRGVIFAIAHIRGGGEMGEPWHDDGKMMKKRNSFTDFIACAEHLIALKYTSKERLAIEGRSAGGLLMGGVLTLRPDLARVAILEVPFLEAINTMLDETLPLTVPEFLEWGNPKKPDEYKYMKSYCPYTNLRATDYPTMLVMTSFYDSQVMYWEPAKYVAKLRGLKTDSNPLLFRCNMTAGHGGASGRYDYLRERAFVYAFLLTQLGVEKVKG
jgi:oligopeptidase B